MNDQKRNNSFLTLGHDHMPYQLLYSSKKKSLRKKSETERRNSPNVNKKISLTQIKSKFELNRCDLSLLLKYDKIFGSVFVFQVTSVLRSLY